MRFWAEINIRTLAFECADKESAESSGAKWFPCNKGGEFRRWYGNNIFVVDWEHDGLRIKAQKGSYIRNPQYYFKKGITWSTISSSKLSMRYSPQGFLFETKGSVCFPESDDIFFYLFSLLNSNVSQLLLTALSPTLDYHEGPIGKIPVVISNDTDKKCSIDCKTQMNIKLAKDDWDSYETSWDFKRHPLV